MPVFFASLNSGSNGNCYYVGTAREGILVDAGICCKEVEIRMQRLGLNCQALKAIFISHEHTDHVAGVSVLANKYHLPVYITGETLRNAGIRIHKSLIFPFDASEAVHIGGLLVKAFRKNHDACDPHSFIVTAEGLNVGVFTDIGSACAEVVYHFKQCHAAFLESNYDDDMLMKGRYPYFLKNRIRGGMGHLSNAQALQLFTDHRPAFMSHLLLAHLSQENNRPELVRQLFQSPERSVQIDVASRYQESSVYQIHAGVAVAAPRVRPKDHTQLSLF